MRWRSSSPAAETSNEKRRVVLLAPSLTRTPGGISRYAEGLITSSILSHAGFALEHLTTHEHGWWGRKLLIASRASIKLPIMRANAGVAHALIASDSSYLRKVILLGEARLLGLKTIAHFQGSTVVEWLSSLPTRYRRWVVRMTEKCDTVVTLGNRLAQYFRSQGMRAPLQVIPNAVDLAPSHDGPKAGPRYILSAGALGHRKGTLDLLHAFARISADFPDTSLILAGDGAVEDTRARAQALGLGERVRCTGWLDKGPMARLLERCTVFALPSHNEGMAFAVLEAMMRAIPVVTTPVGEHPSAISDEREGLLVPPGDVPALARALSRLLREPELAGTLGRAARDRAMREFTLSANHSAVAALYSSLLSGQIIASVTQR